MESEEFYFLVLETSWKKIYLRNLLKFQTKEWPIYANESSKKQLKLRENKQ